MMVKDSKIIKGVKLVEPEIYRDYRGENLEVYSEKKYSILTDYDNKPIKFVVDSISCSHKNVLRGLHGDTTTWKLIQCHYGNIYFVIADFRKEEASYLKWESFMLNDKERMQILVPPGCLNGHLCLSEACIFSYKKSAYYIGAESEIILKWNDKRLNIPWPIKNPILSRRDSE